jgi:hypothetical protein
MDPFLQAALPDPFTILGRRLEPLSIGHLLFLQRFDCDPVLTLDQLLRAVYICCRPPGEVGAALSDRSLRPKLRAWARAIGPFNLPAKLKLWRDYVEHHITARPQLLQEEEPGGGPVLGAPWLQHLKVTLISKLGYTHTEALSIPYGQAIWDYYTFWENAGRAELFGPEHQRMRDLANQMDEETKAALGTQFGVHPLGCPAPLAPGELPSTQHATRNTPPCPN